MRTYRRWLVLSACLLSAQFLFGQKPTIVTEGDSVKFYVGRHISIDGPIVNTKKIQGKDGAMAFLDMFKPGPENPFSITIFRESLAFFEPVEQYNGKRVRINGEVSSFKDKKTNNNRYSIVLRKPSQIEILQK